MGKQIRLLTKISLCNLCGINEFRFTKDKKKKTRYCMMAVLWCFLILLLISYVCSFSFGLCYLNMGNLVPAVLSMIVSIIVFLFTMFKTGPVLFDRRAYERQIALPVTVRSLIVSRFLTMYITNMLLGLLVMLPGMIMYGILKHPAVTFYLYGLIASLFLPLLPLTAASVFGAFITGISSRFKKKNLAVIVLSMLFVCAIMFGSLRMSRMDETQLSDLFINAAKLIEAQVQNIYPPAIWITKAMVYGNAGMLLLFLAVSLFSFILFLEILRHFYEKICNLLQSGEAGRNYKMQNLSAKSVRKSMVERELRHYFSSTVYVTNTLVGNVLTVFIAGAILIMGKDAIENMVGMPGIVEKVLPIMLGALPAMMPTTACSVSMEGKQWWLMQTLPIREKDMLTSKVLANLLVASPFYLISELLVLIAIRPNFSELLCLLFVPAVYILFGAKAGIVINRKFPVFDWENETRVVKQSVSTLLMLLVGAVVGLLPLAAIIYFSQIPTVVIYAVFVILLSVFACIPYTAPKRA